MADFEAPSFSLGLDLDFDAEPQVTATENPSSNRARHSTVTNLSAIVEEDEFESDFESPTEMPDQPRSLKRLRRGPVTEPSPTVRSRESMEMGNCDDDIEDFSSQQDLHNGLDLDFNLEPQVSATENPSSNRVRQSSTVTNLSTIVEEDKDDFESPTEILKPIQSLKILCHGATAKLTPTMHSCESMEVGNVDDDIENFSSQEDFNSDKLRFPQYQTVCSSTKFPLQLRGTSITRSERHCKVSKKKQALNTPASANMETSSTKMIFQDLTVSPLRRFQLIDSDSDDSSVREDANVKTDKVDSYLMERESTSGQLAYSNEQREKPKGISQIEDLWKDFYSDKSFNISTPALDEFCEEYFRSQNNNNSKSYKGDGVVNTGDAQHWDLTDPLPPSHCYFFHDDQRIQRLVRSRLDNFFPLGAVNDNGNKGLSVSSIDYMSQFGHEEGSKRASAKINSKSGSARTKNPKRSKVEECSQASGGWVNPKYNEIPKDAGKRRVHAVGRSSGHWYTNPDGKRVYVSKNGQELTGQIAYKHYKKESGARFKRSKKKTNAKSKRKS